MAGTYKAVGTYANLVNATSAGAKTEIQALIAKFEALITNASGASMASPEFDRLHPALSGQLLAETAAIKAAIAAGA